MPVAPPGSRLNCEPPVSREPGGDTGERPCQERDDRLITAALGHAFLKGKATGVLGSIPDLELGPRCCSETPDLVQPSNRAVSRASIQKECVDASSERRVLGCACGLRHPLPGTTRTQLQEERLPGRRTAAAPRASVRSSRRADAEQNRPHTRGQTRTRTCRLRGFAHRGDGGSCPPVVGAMAASRKLDETWRRSVLLCVLVAGLCSP
ncbi:hypothetical protein MJG53_016063 [Ovis ammon polii x Ovis aries]|uniref:Uncharacterized protein n=1 Tax=Ovis ammon polii x Ovis aries TaxID=2918886 RepID=A0ACB9UAZ2_9CETA|nr:hypothetical protein MJG53_016063 [Ovis ammon polii x Ovis aries]